MDAEPTHLALVVAALRRVEALALEKFLRHVPYPRVARLEGELIHVRHADGTPLVQFRRLRGDVFRLEHRRPVRGVIRWVRVDRTQDGTLPSLLLRWSRGKARFDDLMLDEASNGQERAPLPPPVALLPPPAPAPPVRSKPMSGAKWLASPTPGPVEIEPLTYRGGSIPIDWDSDGEMSPAQFAAARVLVERAREVEVALLDALFRDSVDFAEDPDFEGLTGPDQVRDHTWISSARICAEERDGLAYTALAFHSGAWRIEHGLAAIMHGVRVVSVGGVMDQDPSSDTGPFVEPRSRTTDGARVAEAWMEQPHDGPVAFPMWDGRRGRFNVRLEFEDAEQLRRTDAQLEAAARLVRSGEAVRSALLDAICASVATSPRALRAGIATRRDVEDALVASELVVHAEELDQLAYTELRFEVPWSKKRVCAVMHGARVVAVTDRAGATDAIDADQDAAIRARKQRKRR